MKPALLLLFAAPFLTTAGYAASGGSVDTPAPTSWNQAAAAHYLDSRQVWWQGWDVSQRDHKTVCVSCHTVLPYALARSSLHTPLGEEALSVPENVMLNNVLRRVTMWNQVQPFYANGKAGPTKTPESRGTESVLNALILATYDIPKNHLTDITRSAFNDAWALQIKTGEQAGAWDWLNFQFAPWESNESQYYGASLAAPPTLLLNFINFPTVLIPHLLTILCSICRPKDKDKVLHSRLPALEPLSSMKSTSSAAYERSLRMNHFNSSERTSSSSYITTRMAEKFLLQDKLYGFSMGKSLTKNRRKFPKVQ